MSRGDSVKIWSHPGASVEDLIDPIKPAIHKNPNIVVIHASTNGLQNNGSIVKMAEKLVSTVKEADKDNSVKIAFSSIINREDEDFQDKINTINNKLENYWGSAGMDFIDSSNIDGSCLNRDKLDLSRKGTAALAKHLCRFVRSLPVDWTGCESAFIGDEVNSLDNLLRYFRNEKIAFKKP